MENLREENKRALNIIWNASDDYSFQPEVKSYDKSGMADLYFNYIIGAARKYYDYPLLNNFFNYLKKDSDHEFYEKLTWIGLENCTYNKGKKERPVIESLRRDYSRKILMGETETSDRDILEVIKKAHFKRALGEEPQITGRVLNILNDLEFDESMSTEQIILRMNEIIKAYFKFNYGNYENNEPKNTDNKKYKETADFKEERLHDSESKITNDLYAESAETSRKIDFQEFDEIHEKISYTHNTADQIINTDRSYIQKYYGASILPEIKTKSLEQILCVGNHKKAHLHFTRGEFDTKAGNDADAVYHKKVASEQREINLNYYNENYARNYGSISRLTNKIRNTIYANFQSSFFRSKAGKLAADKIWRNIHVNDNKVFVKNFKNDMGNLSVDIMLDASASQIERQEIIASQGYIIAESFTRCQIPVRVYSFCSLRNYTIVNLYRDYVETDKNDKIFNYNTSGCNRDGLAIRTALHMMGNAESEHKILIVLSDCKPNDIQSIPATGIVPAHSEYSGAMGVNDTALEVKKGINNGVSILCVFTGEDEDVASAKKIYGHNFARIKSPERFADIVGVLMQNQLKNL